MSSFGALVSGGGSSEGEDLGVLTRAGWLQKRGKWNKAFKKRWFVLSAKCEPPVLAYYDDVKKAPQSLAEQHRHEHSKASGVIVLDQRQGTTVRSLDVDDPDYPDVSVLAIVTKERNYYLKAEDAKDAASWIKSIEQVIARKVEQKSIVRVIKQAASGSAAASSASGGASADPLKGLTAAERIEARRAAREEAKRQRELEKQRTRRSKRKEFNDEFGTGGDGAEEPVAEPTNSDRLANAIAMANEAAGRGADTLNQLSQQTEQMHRVKDDLREINEHMDAAEFHMRGINSWGGMVTNQMTGNKDRPAHAQKAVKVKDAPLQQQQQQQQPPPKDGVRESRRGLGKNNKASPGGGASKGKSAASDWADMAIANGAQQQQQQAHAQLQAEDQALSQLHGVLKVLHNQADDAGAELDRQAELLDEIDEDVDVTSARIQAGNRNLQKMIKKF